MGAIPRQALKNLFFMPKIAMTTLITPSLATRVLAMARLGEEDFGAVATVRTTTLQTMRRDAADLRILTKKI